MHSVSTTGPRVATSDESGGVVVILPPSRSNRGPAEPADPLLSPSAVASGRTLKRQREDIASTHSNSNMGVGVMRMFFDEVSGFNPRSYLLIFDGSSL